MFLFLVHWLYVLLILLQSVFFYLLMNIFFHWTDVYYGNKLVYHFCWICFWNCLSLPFYLAISLTIPFYWTKVSFLIPVVFLLCLTFLNLGVSNMLAFSRLFIWNVLPPPPPRIFVTLDTVYSKLRLEYRLGMFVVYSMLSSMRHV